MHERILYCYNVNVTRVSRSPFSCLFQVTHYLESTLGLSSEVAEKFRREKVILKRLKNIFYHTGARYAIPACIIKLTYIFIMFYNTTSLQYE